MNCEFQSLYCGDDGYVVCCKNCGYYQLAFQSILLNLSQAEFNALHDILQYKCENYFYPDANNIKNILVQTPGPQVLILLTLKEAKCFLNMLEEADSEAKALSLISMFNV